MKRDNSKKASESQEKNLIEHNDDLKFKDFEFSYIPYERIPNPNSPGGFPSPGFGFPGGLIPTPGSNKMGPSPKGGFNPNQMGPPPGYIPSKNDKNVQFLSSSSNSSQTKAVSPNSISFCLYKFTYIWESNGRSYWAYLFNVDRVSVSGMRWMGFYWVYFGIDLKRIDSFVCYRGDCEECSKNDYLREASKNIAMNIKKEYKKDEIRTICSQTLSSLDIPECKNDLIVETVGYVDDKPVQTEIPCVKYRNNNYKIVLDVSFNDSINEDNKKEIIDIAKSCGISAYNEINSNTRGNSSPLENFDASKGLIKNTLKAFDNEFTKQIKDNPNLRNLYNDIDYSIREEINTSNWIVN